MRIRWCCIIMVALVPCLGFGEEQSRDDPAKTPDRLKTRTERFDVAKYVEVEGKVLTYEEALPRLKAMLVSTNAETVIDAVKNLGWYGDSIAGSDVVEALVILYRKTPSPAQADTASLSRIEAQQLELKLQILATVAATGDARRGELLSAARLDRNESIRKMATRIEDDVKRYDHLQKGGKPALEKAPGE
jgi:hypothetical protein